MTALLLAIVLTLVPVQARSEVIHVRIEVTQAAATSVPPVDALEAGLKPLFERAFDRYAVLDFEGSGTPDAGTPNAGALTARVIVDRRGALVSADTDLTRRGLTRSLSSTVPPGAAGSLVSAIEGDLAFLFFSLNDFSALPLSPAPSLAASLQTDSLAQVTAWDPSELEPLDLAEAPGGVVICFPHRYLTLGGLFQVTADTIADIDAQSSGREPLQLSGALSDAAGSLFLLSEATHAIVQVRPRLGTRTVLDAPELSAMGARALEDGRLAILAQGDAASVFVRAPAGGVAARLPVAASYVSAFCGDREGNAWLWDASERRIRILAPSGLETCSIKPLFKAGLMPLPQQLQVLDDGSFLLGGSGEIWKFAGTGVPVWRLTRIPGRPAEKLPSSFVIAADTADGSFALLDAPSRRLLWFAEPSPGTLEAELAAALSRMDGRKAADLSEAAALAGRAGLPLMQWQLADALAGRTGEESEKAQARIAVLRQKCELYVGLADSLARDLLYARADNAYLRAGEWLRELSAESPGDTDAARLLAEAVSRRQQVRADLGASSDVRVVSAQAVASGLECAGGLAVRLRLRNTGTERLSTLRIHLNLPTVAAAPSLAALESLAPGEEREVELQLDLARARVVPAGTATGLALVTYVRGMEGISSPLSFPVETGAARVERSAAQVLPCGVQPADQLVASLPDDLLPAADRADSLASFASVMEALDRMRSLAVAARAAPASAAPSAGARSTLRGFPANERDWALLTVSLASTFGLPSGLFIWNGGTLALLETDVTRAEARAVLPGLGRYDALLSSLSRGDRLVVPLSARPTPVGAPAVAWSVVDGLASLDGADLASASIAWWDPSLMPAPAQTVPMAFPYPVAAAHTLLTREALVGEIAAEIERTVR